MDRFQELMARWRRRDKKLCKEMKYAQSDELERCIEDLKDTMIFEEADKVLAQAAQELRGTGR